MTNCSGGDRFDLHELSEPLTSLRDVKGRRARFGLGSYQVRFDNADSGGGCERHLKLRPG